MRTVGLVSVLFLAGCGSVDWTGLPSPVVVVTPTDIVVRFPNVSRLELDGRTWPVRGDGYVLVGGLEPGTEYDLFADGTLRATVRTPERLDPAELRERILGGWLGKCIGNEFGLPFEQAGLFVRLREPFSADITTWDAEVDGVQGRVPVNHYVNDDTGLAYLALLTVETHGLDFTSEQHAATWSRHLTGCDEHLWCAEPFAVDSINRGVMPPESGRNPYSSHLDAQMRADIFGLLAPGDLTLASDLARRDACVSNAGEGIDGAVFVAVMTSAACYWDEPRDVVRAGLAAVPEDSRHARVLRDALAWSRDEADWRVVWSRLQRAHAEGRYEAFGDHTESMILAAPNAGNIALGLLYGDGDFAKSIAIALTASWDTDCNAGNVGAVVGAQIGESAIPSYWRRPLNDEFSIRGFYAKLPDVVSIRSVADRIAAAAN